MSEQESIKAALETVLSNSKVSGLIAALTGSSGAAAVFGNIHSILGSVSLAIGCVVGIYTLRILRVKHRIMQRMERDGESLKD